MMSPARKIATLKSDFLYYAPNVLKIRPKTVGVGVVPFSMKPAQLALHQAVEDMRNDVGYVRLLVLKGRQLGISTYVGGRFYHQVSMRRGIKAFILAHVADSTAALFKMTARYHENNPLAPSTGSQSTKTLTFDKLDSGYGVGTAGAASVGRGCALLRRED